MRIAVDASIQRAGAAFPTGVERAQRALVTAVRELAGDDVELIAVAPSVACAEAIGLDPSQAVGAVEGDVRPWAWRETHGVAAARAAGCDVWWSPVTALPVRGGIDAIATVYDVPWGASSRGIPAVGERGVTARARLAHTARNAWRIVCPSQRTADDVSALHAGTVERLRVVPLGVVPPQVDESTVPREGVLCVGTLRAKKNFGVVLDALCDPRLEERGVRATLVGAPGSASAQLNAHGAAPRMRFAGPLGDDALAAEYARAAVVVVPSWLEGFGLVALEALAAGAPVIVSRQAFVAEACGEAVLMFDAASALSLADAIVRVLDDESWRTTARDAGRALVAQRSAEGSARAMLDVLTEWSRAR